MKCENCQEDHDGSFASGRFCSKVCSSSFSTKGRRVEINKKVSEKMVGKPTGRLGIKLGPLDDKILTKRREKIKASQDQWKVGDWETVQKGRQRDRILLDQGGCCAVCRNPPTWMGKPLKFQLDHISGDHQDNGRANLRLVCPNCHYQTTTWGSQNASEEGRARMLEALNRRHKK